MKLISTFKELLNDFVSLVFPKICIHCGTSLVHQEDHICTWCRLDLPKTDFHLDPDHPLKQKFTYEPKVQNAAAYLHFHKRGIAQSLIHHLKYKGLGELGVQIGRWYGEDLGKSGWPVDCIIPVPLHASKLKKRGYNQSEQFAAGLSAVMAVPVCSDQVVRHVRTATQTKKSKIERLQNIDSVYSVVDPAVLKGKNVLIVDDVLTTGATIGELAMLLARCEVDGIYIAVIAAGK